jgi:hypothetical protein
MCGAHIVLPIYFGTSSDYCRNIGLLIVVSGIVCTKK